MQFSEDIMFMLQWASTCTMEEHHLVCLCLLCAQTCDVYLHAFFCVLVCVCVCVGVCVHVCACV